MMYERSYLRYWVVVDVNDFVKIARNYFSDFF